MEREESDLYGLPLDEFVPRRTELERRLRKEGERERAAAVKKLPKPSVAAWAVNQASRCRPKERRALLAASAELRDVQERLMSGKAAAADLERATGAQREAIDGLLQAAAGLLTSDGKSMGDTTLARVRETFAAVATDEELAELIEAGTLDRERQATGLGFALGAEPAPAREGAKAGGSSGAKAGGSSGAKAGGSAGARGRRSPNADAELAARKAAEKEAAAARERAEVAKRAEREAAKRLEAAERAARKAAEQLERRERQAEEARAAAEEARTELDAARAEHAERAREREEAES